jgi:hypothetical protein
MEISHYKGTKIAKRGTSGATCNLLIFISLLTILAE